MIIKSKIIDFFFRKKTCDESEKKNTSTSSKLEKLLENPKIKENKK